MKFIALLSLLCHHYSWSHDFWRKMGLREFRAWCEQRQYEAEMERLQRDGWRATENDPGWQAMRKKRDRARGR